MRLHPIFAMVAIVMVQHQAKLFQESGTCMLPVRPARQWINKTHYVR